MKQLLRWYLLGQLDNELQHKVEDCYFANDLVFHQLLQVENELIEEYLHRNLNKMERLGFEECYLITAKRRRRVQLTAELIGHSSNNKPP